MPDFLEKHASTFMVLGVGIAGFAALVVIMGQHFNAQQRINSQFFQLVAQRLDAQGERMNERFEQITQRLDAQDERMNERFEQINQRLDAQDERMNEHFKLINQRFEQVDRRLDGLTGEVSELRRLMVSVSERVARNEGEIDVIREHLRIADTPSP